LQGQAPPAGRYIDGTFDGTTFTIARDADNNATGGVRLPHMLSTVNGLSSGAPLGHYFGTDTTEPANGFRLVGGVFTPFTDAELDARYPNHGPLSIKNRVQRAADQLFDDRLILREDRDDYKRDPHGPK
jgi:hypothetical protein